MSLATSSPRRAAELVLDALGDTQVVVVNGARQVGKSTLAEVVLRQVPGGVARFLDEPVTRAAAAADPVRFLQHDGLMRIDEVQRVPDLWLAIKHTVERDPRPGRFLLTGSARLLGLRSLPDTLPGRTETIELWPLSQGGIGRAPDGFVDAAFARGADVRTDAAGLPLNISRLAGELTITAPTARNYLDILETIFLVKRVPARSAGATTRAVGTPN